MGLRKKYYLPVMLFLSIYIIMFCVLGLYNWPYPGDDFGFAAILKQNGFLKALTLTYNTWTGRIMNVFLIDLCVLFPLETFYPFLAIINVLTYMIAVYILVGTIRPGISISTRMLLTLLIMSSTLAFTYSLHETFYWLAGSPYFWCTSLMLISLAWAIKSIKGGGDIFICA